MVSPQSRIESLSNLSKNPIVGVLAQLDYHTLADIHSDAEIKAYMLQNQLQDDDLTEEERSSLNAKFKDAFQLLKEAKMNLVFCLRLIGEVKA